MAKIIDCNKVNPVSGWPHVVRGAEGLARNAEEHGIVQVTPELLTEIKTHIRDE
jgi:hypothetical protein